jgi:hypothetical protein
MTVIGASPYVQVDFNDQPGYGYPGQLESMNQLYNPQTIGYSTEAQVFCGRAVRQKTVQNFSTNNVQNVAPFTIDVVTTGILATAIPGVVTRPFVATQSYTDTDGVYKAGFGAKTVVPVIPFGSKARVYVRQAPGVGAIAYGDPVYVALSASNDFGLFVGEFGNALDADDEDGFMLLIPNAIWLLQKTTSTTNDEINIIQLN